MLYNVIVVLGGGMTPEGQLPEKAQWRVERAVELYKQGIASRIIMTGSIGFLARFTPTTTEAQIMKDHAIKLGVPEEDVLMETQSKDTIGNAFFAKKQYLEPNNWKNIIIVSSDFHGERALFIFGKVLGNEYHFQFDGSRSGLSAQLMYEKYKKEQTHLFVAKQFFDGIKPGDDEGIKKKLYEEHPGYAEYSRISKEEFKNMLQLAFYRNDVRMGMIHLIHPAT